MTSEGKILLLGEIEHAHEFWSRISQAAQVVEPKASTRQEFIAECQSGAFDGVSVALRTFSSLKVTGKFDRELLSALPSSLKFLCSNGAGYDDFDIQACTAHGVRVSNTPTAVDEATADVTMWLVIGALRNFSAGMANLREGNWRGKTPMRLGHDPQGKVLGILGMGGIGRNVAAKARVFGFKKIRYHNRNRLSPQLENGAEYVSFEKLLGESDVLSLNLPLNPQTRHMISTEQFNMMKPGIVVVNSARGAVMDEPALVDALNSGKVSSVGLDVFEKEPEIHPGLRSNPNVLLLPHMGTWTVETETKMEECMLENVIMAMEEGRLKNVVPEQREVFVGKE